METKSFELAKYQRLYQETGDLEYLAKYAEAKGGEAHRHFTLPSVKQFLEDLVTANEDPLDEGSEHDQQQTALGQALSGVLAAYFAGKLEPESPAFRDEEFHSDVQAGLVKELSSIPEADWEPIVADFARRLRRLGDQHLASLAHEADVERVKNLAHFVMARAYVHAYWTFLFHNPLASVIVQNKHRTKEAVLSISQLLTTAADEDDEGEDDEEGKKKKKPREHKGRNIEEGAGYKVRLSHLIQAMKITRARLAVQVASSLEDSYLNVSYVTLDANIDHLERSLKALKDYVREDPKRSYFTWFGQPLGDGDLFIINTGRDFTTLNKMLPTKLHEIRKAGGSISDINIPYVNWQGKPDRISKLDPTNAKIYQHYASQHLRKENLGAYLQKIQGQFLEDQRLSRDQIYAVAQSQNSRMTDRAKEHLVRATFHQIEDPLLTNSANRLWTFLHDTSGKNFLDRIATDPAALEKSAELYEGLILSALEFAKTIPAFGQVLMPNSIYSLRQCIEQVLTDIGILRSPAMFTRAFVAGTDIFRTKPADVKNIKKLLKDNFALDEDGREKIREEIRAEIQRRVLEIDKEVGYDPKKDRDPGNYEGLVESIKNQARVKYMEELKPESLAVANSGVWNLVNNLAVELFPDVFLNQGSRFFRDYYNKNYTRPITAEVMSTLDSAYYHGQYQIAEEDYAIVKEEFKKSEMYRRLADPVVAGMNIIQKNPTKIGFPKEASKQSIAAITERMKSLGDEKQNILSDEISLYAVAWAEDVRQWLRRYRIPSGALESHLKGGDPDRHLDQLLAEAYGPEVKSRSLFAYIGRELTSRLGNVLVPLVTDKFGGARLFDSDIRYDLMIGSMATNPEVAARLKRGEDVDVVGEKIKEAEAADREQRKRNKAAGGDKEKDPKREQAENEVKVFIDQYAKDHEVGRMARKRFSRHMKKGDPFEFYDLPTTSGGGAVLALMSHHRSDYLDQLFSAEDPMALTHYWVSSVGMGLGGHINRETKKDFNGWVQATYPDGGLSLFMQNVEAFPEPLWAIAPFSHAFGNLESRKRQSGATDDVPDTCEFAVDRAIYACHPVGIGFTERVKAYFKAKRAEFIALFPGVDPAKAQKYLILRYWHRPGVPVLNNPSNAPFQNMTPKELAERVRLAGISADQLNQYFGELKKANNLYKRKGIPVETPPDLSDKEASWNTKEKREERARERDKFTIIDRESAYQILRSIKAPAPTAQANIDWAVAEIIKIIDAKTQDIEGVQKYLGQTVQFAREVMAILPTLGRRVNTISSYFKGELSAAIGGHIAVARANGRSPLEPTFTPAAAEKDVAAEQEAKKTEELPGVKPPKKTTVLRRKPVKKDESETTSKDVNSTILQKDYARENPTSVHPPEPATPPAPAPMQPGIPPAVQAFARAVERNIRQMEEIQRTGKLPDGGTNEADLVPHIAAAQHLAAWLRTLDSSVITKPQGLQQITDLLQQMQPLTLPEIWNALYRLNQIEFIKKKLTNDLGIQAIPPTRAQIAFDGFKYHL